MIGGATFHLAALMRSPSQRIIDSFQNGCGVLHVHAESLSSTRDNFVTTFSAQKLVNKEGFFSKSDPFLLISRQNEDGRWSVVWRSQHVDNNLNPIWPECKIPIALLCNGDIDRPVKIEIFDFERSGKHVFMGQVETNVRLLLQARGQPVPVVEPEQQAKKKNYVNSGVLLARSPSIEKNATFADVSAPLTCVCVSCRVSPRCVSRDSSSRAAARSLCRWRSTSPRPTATRTAPPRCTSRTPPAR